MGYCLTKVKLSQGFSVAKLHSLVNNNSQINLFVWDPTESVATRPLFMVANPGNYKLFYTFDGNKNVSELVHFESRNGIAALTPGCNLAAPVSCALRARAHLQGLHSAREKGSNAPSRKAQGQRDLRDKGTGRVMGHMGHMRHMGQKAPKGH